MTVIPQPSSEPTALAAGRTSHPSPHRPFEFSQYRILCSGTARAVRFVHSIAWKNRAACADTATSPAQSQPTALAAGSAPNTTTDISTDADPSINLFEVSVVMPCLNEVRTLAGCIRQAREALDAGKLHGEIIVADNGSTDGSVELAQAEGAKVVHVARRGYGSALQGGFAAARGEYIFMADADGSYDFGEIPRFVAKLREGYDLVMGNRFAGEIKPGAMPWHHRYIGNPVLSGIGRVLFRPNCKDLHCGMRSFSRAIVEACKYVSPGMEFATEMVVKATMQRVTTCEIPISLSPDGRNRPPHLRSFRDGIRHLLLLLSLRCNKRILLQLLVQLLFVLAMRSELLADDSEDSQLVSAAIQAMRTNDEKLGAHKMILRETLLPKVESARGSSGAISHSADGGIFKLDAQTPPVVSTYEMIASKNFFERRSFDPTNRLLHVWQRDSAIWNEFLMSQRVVIIRSEDQLPGTRAVDLSAAPNLGEGIEEFIRKSEIQQVSTVEDAAFGVGSFQVTLLTERNMRSELVFAANQRFLPVRHTEYSPSGVAIFDREFTYETAADRDAFFVRTIKSTIRVDSAVTPPELRQILFEGDIVLSVEQFQLIDFSEVQRSRTDWDSGWLVQDMTKWNPPGIVESPRIKVLPILLMFVLVVGLGSVFYRLRVFLRVKGNKL